jgi:hypothetical protein
MRIALLTIFTTLCLFLSSPRYASAEDVTPEQKVVKEQAREESAESSERSWFTSILLYIPSRLCDITDIFRLRVKVGPGAAAGVRATKLAQLYVGSQTSLYAGLPGPRRSATIPFPVGIESYNGIAVSVVEATAGLGADPDYSPTEFGITLHPLFFGIDVGFDPVELLDFTVGIIGFDIREDDF